MQDPFVGITGALGSGLLPYPPPGPEREAWMRGHGQGCADRWRPAEERLTAGELLPCYRCGEPSLDVIPNMMGGLPI